MIKVEKFTTYGWESAVRGMRNPMNSWAKSDSEGSNIGWNDLNLMMRLRNGGSDDRKFMRQIFVSCDITAPLYWWKEMDQYKVSTVTNSCSTMHKISSKPFDIDDFSHDHLMNVPDCDASDFFDLGNQFTDDILYSPTGILQITVDALNLYRNKYIETGDKKYWWQMIQLLPSSYNQKRTWTANYEVLTNIYHARHNHKLDEWHTFCDEILKLPYAKELIVGEK